MTPEGPKTQLSRLIKLAEKGERVVITRSGRRVVTIPAHEARPQRVFLDTNILLYCDDPAHISKQRRALELVLEHKAQRTGVVSLQVLQEYFVNATGKLGRAGRRRHSRRNRLPPAAPDLLLGRAGDSLRQEERMPRCVD